MKKLKRTFSIILALVTIICSIVCFSSVSASAATRGGEYTSGMQVWTNKTGLTPYVTLSQTPAIYQYKNIFGNTKQKEIYKNYWVEFVPKCTVDGKKTNAKKVTGWLDCSSKKFKLSKGVYYEMRIESSLIAVKLPSLNGKYTRSSSWNLKKIYNCGNYK